MKKSSTVDGRNTFLFAFLTVLCFGGCFVLLPLGTFTIWITAGGTVYFLFLTVYSLLSKPPNHKFRRKRADPNADEKKAYIQFHLRILLIMFLLAALFVIALLWFLG